MAEATFASEGYAGMLLALIEGGDWWIHLYTNDPPVNGALRADQLVEPVYVGYQAQPLRKWTPPVLRGATAFSVSDPVAWRWTEGEPALPIRGYYVTHAKEGPLAWARRRPGEPYPLGPESALLLIMLTLTFPPAGGA